MSSLAYSKELLIASQAVQSASVLTKKIVHSVFQNSTLSKSDSSPVTLADFAAQALLIGFIHHYFPDDDMVGEEDADVLRKDKKLLNSVWEIVSSHLKDERDQVGEREMEMLARPIIKSKEEMCDVIDLGGHGTGEREGRVWMLDPVDGTAAFLRGEQYAVALALVVDGEEKVGVLGCPMLKIEEGKISEKIVDWEGFGLMISAVKGQGALMRSMGKGVLQPASKVERRDSFIPVLDGLQFVEMTASSSVDLEKHQEVAKRLGAQWPGTDLWSSQMRYMALAVGGCDIKLRIARSKDKRPYVWDHAGGHLIYREVGGMLTNLDGKELDFKTGRRLEGFWAMIAAPEVIHARILETVVQVLQDKEGNGHRL